MTEKLIIRLIEMAYRIRLQLNSKKYQVMKIRGICRARAKLLLDTHICNWRRLFTWEYENSVFMINIFYSLPLYMVISCKECFPGTLGVIRQFNVMMTGEEM